MAFKENMNKFIIISLLLLLFITSISFGQRVDVQNVTNSFSLKRDGIFYALPKTILVVEIEVKKTVYTPPKGAKKENTLDSAYLKIINGEIFVKDSVIEISNYSISTKSTQDLDQVFLLNPKKKWNKKTNIAFSLSEQGIIQGSEVSIEDKTFDLVTEGLSSIASIASAVLGGAVGAKPISDKRTLENLLDKRANLITSTSYGGDGEAIKFQIKELDKMIESEMAKLIGSKKITTATFRFEIDLDCTERSYELLKVISSGHSLGIHLIPENKNDHILYPQKFIAKKDSGNVLRVEISNSSVSSYGQLIKNLGASNETKRGLAYRIPKNKIIKIVFEKEDKLISSIPIAQCGSIAYLPYKMDKVNIKYYESLGSLKSVSAEAGSINAENFDVLAGTIKSGKDISNGKSELERLNEENQLLEAIKKNKELKNN